MSDDYALPGRILYVETSGITNDLLRAMAGAHPSCVGYPDGVPEVFGVAPGFVMPRPMSPFDHVCRPDWPNWLERDSVGDEEC